MQEIPTGKTKYPLLLVAKFDSKLNTHSTAPASSALNVSFPCALRKVGMGVQIHVTCVASMCHVTCVASMCHVTCVAAMCHVTCVASIHPHAHACIHTYIKRKVKLTEWPICAKDCFTVPVKIRIMWHIGLFCKSCHCDEVRALAPCTATDALCVTVKPVVRSLCWTPVIEYRYYCS